MADLMVNGESGPALYYVHSDQKAVTRVDLVPVEAMGNQDPARMPTSRERAICKALLIHALELLDKIDSPDE